MISHQHVCVYMPAMTLARLHQRAFERRCRTSGFEHIGLVVPAIDDVVKRAWVTGLEVVAPPPRSTQSPRARRVHSTPIRSTTRQPALTGNAPTPLRVYGKRE